ncbi:MAG: Hsp70 family protein, partial [Chloroflexota bacterium]|nr:Hsp70 family protein [Chloroflexota bacterium]
LIERNTTIPTSKSEMFTTASDSQNSVDVHVLQGERPMANENKTIGRFMLDGILPAPRGVPQIEVTFDLDANGILNVTAHDKATGKEQRITITASSGLSKDEVDRMVREAEMHADEDRRRREEIDAKNHADNLAYQTEKNLTEMGDRVPADLRAEAEGKIAAIRSAIQSGGADQMKLAAEELEATMQKIGSAVYSHAGAGAEPGGGFGGGGYASEGYQDRTNDDTVEGEFREV